MKLVIVESPSKAKTINKYLGSDYKVIASFGHVRDLPPKTGSVVPEENFHIKYEIVEKSGKYVDEIKKLAKKADDIYLATDPDREGESISWHVTEILKQNKIVKDDAKFKRIAFNEITKKAILEAVANPRKIDDSLVNAQQARRALDYLVGFTLSPILWRKLPGCRSAGRVQSVALRIICEREDEIEHFKSREFWDIGLDVLNSHGDPFTARLSHIENQKLEKFSITDKAKAHEIVDKLKKQNFNVSAIQKKQQKRSPAAPFITSSLQQEASRKLGFSAKKTMQVAQKLYEGIEIGGETIGLITYMRTDGVTLSGEAIDNIRSLIHTKYGDQYLPASPRVYKSKLKNAQEAHEAIRPTDITLTPESLLKELDKDQIRLYELIWKRTIACQMESVLIDMVGADLISDDRNFKARATGSTIVFDGFYKIYQEGKDDSLEEERKTLPPLFESEIITTKKIRPEQHFTEPPPRYSEASLVKRLEELGIGRPSTYASIISVLQDRKYVTVDKKRFHPNDLGRIVTAFLIGYFTKYVEYDFTADLETGLDKIAEGELNWKKLLSDFWNGFNQNVGEASKHDITEVIGYVENSLGFYFFGEHKASEDKEVKKCESCGKGVLSLKLGKYGSFLACNNYPDCTYKKTNYKNEDSGESGITDNIKELGKDKNDQIVYLKKGPYGWYVQLGDVVSKKEKPKRCQLPADVKPEEVTLELAIKLLSLPLMVGKHSQTNEDILMGIGKYGPYLKYQNQFTSIPKSVEPFSIRLEEAEEIIASKPQKQKSTKKVTKTTKITKKK
jgi:DNA topoisomerase-1